MKLWDSTEVGPFLLFPTYRTLSALLTDLSLVGALVLGNTVGFTTLFLHKTSPVCPLCMLFPTGNTQKQKNAKLEKN